MLETQDQVDQNRSDQDTAEDCGTIRVVVGSSVTPSQLEDTPGVHSGRVRNGNQGCKRE